MKRADLFEIIWRNMWKRRTRTIFTMLGVIIGCLSIFIIISITNGFENYLTTSMEQMMDTSVISVYPNYGANENDKDAKRRLTAKDVTLIEETGLFASVTPRQSANTTGKYRNTEVYLGILAKDDYSDIEASAYAVGRAPHQGSREIVLGYQSAKELLGYAWDEDVEDEAIFAELVNKKIKVGNGSYFIDEKGNKISPKNFQTTIVGVLGKSAGAYQYETLSSTKFVETLIKSEIDFQKQASLGETIDLSYLTDYQGIAAKVSDVSQLAASEQTLKGLGYQTTSAIEFENQTKLLLLGVNVVLGALAGISLLVSALGITNTMDMAIYERHKEIGIIKVMGGSVRDVIQIFVGEACAISLVGGIISIIVGLILSVILNAVGSSLTASMLGQPIEQIAMPSLPLIFGILGFCFGIGFLAGIIPARKAARTDIISAIK